MYRKFGLIVATCLALGLAVDSIAQDEETPREEYFHSSSPARSNTPILDRIETAGKNLFGILPLPGLPASRTPAHRSQGHEQHSEAVPPPAAASSSGLRNPAVKIYRNAPSAAMPQGIPSRGGVGSSALQFSETEEEALRTRPAQTASPTTVYPRKDVPLDVPAEPEESTVSEETSDQSKGSPLAMPLHERLRVFRESGFAGAGVGRSSPDTQPSTAEKSPATGGTMPSFRDFGVSSGQTGQTDLPRHPVFSDSAGASSAGASQTPHHSSQPASSETSRFGSFSSRREPTLAPSRSGLPEKTSSDRASLNPSGSRFPGTSSSADSSADSGPSSGLSDRGNGASLGTIGPSGRASPAGAIPSAERAPGTNLSSDPLRSTRPSESENLLMTRESPMLSIQTHGPRRITVGKEAPYEVVIQNSGTVAANDLVVTVDLPPWAEVLATEASIGATQAPQPGDKAGQFLWRVGRLEAKAQEKLVLRIVPRESRPFELGVRWSFTPLRSQAEIEVQEPKLGLALEGPREVLYSQRHIYKLIMMNTGNGPAENVVVSLVSKGAGDQASASHKLGTLSPGEKKVLEVELVPRASGTLTLEVQLQGDGNAQASLTETIVVRKPELRLALTGPKEHFVGAPASYQLQASNPGNASTKNVRIVLNLPEGVENIVSTPEGRLSFDRRKVEWTFPEIAPGASRELTLKCQFRTAGSARIVANASADMNLSATDSINTQVEAVADLTLSVVDPAGPVPVSDEAVYEIRIHNRGTKTATQVEAVAYFSHGIEPVGADGAPNKIGPGQVFFSPIAAIAPGQTQVLKIKAKADRAGNHIFRAEVYCQSAGVRLVSEGTTRYFGSGSGGETQLAQPDPGSTSADSPAVRTAERPSTTSSQESSPPSGRTN